MTIVRTKLGLFAVLSLVVLMIVPAYASVTSISLEKSFYTNDENLKFVGTQDGKNIVFVIIRDSHGKYKGMLSDPAPAQGEFSVIPKSVTSFFQSHGIYNVTAFSDDEKENQGMTIELEYDGNKVFKVLDYVLQLNAIPDVSVEIEKTITFTASLIEGSITDEVFSLKNAPSGATINPNTGKFIWTPSKSHGNIQDVIYNIDVIVTKGNQEDKESFTITVKQAYVKPIPEPKVIEPKAIAPKAIAPEPMEPKELGLASFVVETKDPQSYVDRYNNEDAYKKWFDENFSEYDSIYHAVGLEKPLQIPASFVVETNNLQSYVDRYNNEDAYKKWFDENFSEYDSIYHAVGLEKPLQIPASFVVETNNLQSYVDRYNNEDAYKKWFDENFSEYDSIYHAVGLEESEFGECGEGTDLVDGICMIENDSEGGGCLIATATYGSEMTPQVQLLREIRDNQLMNTQSGISFMSGFNELYYSFSPHIADMERENPVFKEMVKIGITPLLSSLSIMSHAETESEVLGYGIGIILMNLGMYVGMPVIIIFKAKKYIKIQKIF